MRLDARLAAVAALVPQDCVLADIGTDHAYLPTWLLLQGKIKRAIAGDIAAGPCQAARGTVAQYGVGASAEVRQGSGLAVLRASEADCIAICGMGGSTVISILEEDFALACSARRLVLQPMAGAAGLRRWLVEHGWRLVAEDLVDAPPHFYELIAAERGEDARYSAAEYAVGPALLRQRHTLLGKQLARQLALCRDLLSKMERSEQARLSNKYKEIAALLRDLEVLADEASGNG